MLPRKLLTLLLALAPASFAAATFAQANPDAPILPDPSGPTTQTETDEYTRYELLPPETASFKIYYEVTATTAGAKFFYNPIRKGSVATDESVLDAMTGKPLVFAVVHGDEARKDPLMPRADLDTDYIRVTLARPVPEHGQARVIIIKTYKDTKSYFQEKDAIVFNRPLGIRRNKIVLPPGYELTGCTVPSQILTEPDGRIAIAFMHAGTGEPRSSSTPPKISQPAPPPSRTHPPAPAPGSHPSKAPPSAPASPSAPTRTATSSTSSSSPKPTAFPSTTTTPSPAPASTPTPMSYAKAAKPPIPAPTSSTPARSSPPSS